jgi:hypothetical protein
MAVCGRKLVQLGKALGLGLVIRKVSVTINLSPPVAGRPAFPTRQSKPTFGTWPWRLANELANFNIVVEKWDSSKIGGKRGGSKGKQGGAKGYTTARAGHPTHELPLKTR